MAKRMATIMGVGFVLVAILGFIAPSMLGMHLSVTHSIIHLVTGVMSLYFGTRASLSAAKAFCIAFGAVYALLGIGGFLLGTQGAPTVPGPEDARLWKLIPHHFEVGTSDHIVHILLGGLYLIGGLMTRTVRHATDRV